MPNEHLILVTLSMTKLFGEDVNWRRRCVKIGQDRARILFIWEKFRRNLRNILWLTRHCCFISTAQRKEKQFSEFINIANRVIRVKHLAAALSINQMSSSSGPSRNEWKISRNNVLRRRQFVDSMLFFFGSASHVHLFNVSACLKFLVASSLCLFLTLSCVIAASMILCAVLWISFVFWHLTERKLMNFWELNCVDPSSILFWRPWAHVENIHLAMSSKHCEECSDIFFIFLISSSSINFPLERGDCKSSEA